MKKDKIWLSSPHMGGTELKYIHEAFDNNWIAPLGPNVLGFEHDIEEYLNENLIAKRKWDKYSFDTNMKSVSCTALTTGTAAIHLALILLGVKPDDEVICQSMTFCASANPIKYLGANPIFIDSELDTWNMCPDALDECIKERLIKGKKPKAIIVVHLYGMPYKVDEITQIAKKYEIPIIEDAAEALGSTYDNEKCATFGDISVLSFNGNKIITTSGGGALISKNKKYTDEALFIATQARDDAPHYQHSKLGYNYRMSNVSAGIGRGQMEVLNHRVFARREMNKFYQEIFNQFDYISMLKEPDERYFSNHWLSCILIQKNAMGKTNEGLRIALEKENIESRPLWKPMHLQPLYKKEMYFGEKVAENLFKQGLCLPSGSNLTDKDRHRIQSAILKYLSI